MGMGLAAIASPGIAVADTPDGGSASQPSKPSKSSVGVSRRAAQDPSGGKADVPRKSTRTPSPARPASVSRPGTQVSATADSRPVTAPDSGKPVSSDAKSAAAESAAAEQVSGTSERAVGSVPKALAAPARLTATAALSPADIVSGFFSLFGIKGLPPSPVQLLTGMLALIRREIESFLRPPTAVPSVSITDTSLVEGNSGANDAAFTVTLSKSSTKPVTVSYTTADGSATAGQDYRASAGTVTFAPGSVSQVITINVLGDATVELDETFTVVLSNPSGATIGRATATGTITNDDATATTPGGTAQWGKSFFAPYIDMGAYPVPNLLALSKTYGTSLVTLGFMQADANGNLAWAGLAALEPNSTNEQAIAINSSIATFKAAGGDVMISFGGAAGTSIAQYYAGNGRSAQELADAYAAVVDTYGVTHLDFDIEGAAVADPASVTLNAQALALLQKAKPEVQIWYTLPVLPTGLTADGLNVVDSALAAGVNLAGVNVMAMDYGESAAPTSGPNAKTMGAYAIEAAESTYTQVSALYTARSKTFSWSQIGVTPMLGVNDVLTEVFTVADAQALEDFARTKGIGMLSMWQVLRDTPGTLGQSTTGASGLSDPVGSFSNVFNDYGTINVVDYTNAGGSGGAGGTPVTGGTTTTIGWAWGANPVLTFDPAKDTLDFVWMQAAEFDVSDTSGSTVISIVGNNSSYTLAGVTLRQLQIGNIIAKDAGTLAKWKSLIDSAKAV
ncbi:hypothetical protein MHEL_44770 [Mycolicibacterium helvum]|uniref:GH18 domain-containing protein n=2 Tax=Mycolicibacterium helvum TaxID=1534349 RepID=A0A7I7TAG3_9MYCO|nr:hypothetical protein MHEL_44770 [Mycolicibacterium helvum]